MKGIIALNADTFLPGHGGPQTKAELQERLATVTARRDKIKELVSQGKSLAEIRMTLGEPPPPGQFQDFTEVVYTELTKKK